MGTALDLLITVAEMKRGRAYSTLICTGLSTSRGSYPLKIEIVFPYGFTVRVSYKRCTLLCFAFIPPCLVSSKLRDQVDVANVTDSIQGRNRAAQCRIPGENSSGAARAIPNWRRQSFPQTCAGNPTESASSKRDEDSVHLYPSSLFDSSNLSAVNGSTS